MVRIVGIVPDKRVDRLEVKPEGPSREGSTGVWVGTFCDIFSGQSEFSLLLGFFLPVWSMTGMDGWMDEWRLPAKQKQVHLL